MDEFLSSVASGSLTFLEMIEALQKQQNSESSNLDSVTPTSVATTQPSNANDPAVTANSTIAKPSVNSQTTSSGGLVPDSQATSTPSTGTAQLNFMSGPHQASNQHAVLLSQPQMSGSAQQPLRPAQRVQTA